jgi:signal transduction histidine kinase
MIKVKLRTRILCSFLFFTLLITVTFTTVGMLLLQNAEDIITNQQLEILVKNSDIESRESVTIYNKKSDLTDTYGLVNVPEQPGTYEFFTDDDGKQALIPDGFSSRWDMWVTNPREREYRIIIPSHKSETTTKRWIVVDLSDSEYTEASMDSLSILFYILLALFIIIAIVSGLLVARWIMNPIVKLSNAIKNNSEDAPLELPVTSDDELGYLSEVISQYDKNKFQQIKREQAFISDCSHELRTPITIINNSVGILNELPPNDARRENILARISRSGKRMQRLAQTFLLIGRQKKGELKQVIPSQIIDEVIGEIQLINPDHELIVCNNVPKDLSFTSRPESVSILCHNLIGNCFQHLQTGELIITSKINHYTLTLDFTDNGPGFYGPVKENSTNTGYGIGLSLIERLCQRENWNLTLKNNKPQGARISIDLPFTRS